MKRKKNYFVVDNARVSKLIGCNNFNKTCHAMKKKCWWLLKVAVTSCEACGW